MARGDAFKNPVANWALRSLRVLPIFRVSDGAGAEQSSRNQATFDEATAILKRKGSVLIFPEGICILERRLKPMKKGTARLAFDFMKNYPELDLQIMPVGMNYSETGRFREEVCINFAKPIPVSDYARAWGDETSYAKAINEFNDRLFEEIERELVIIKDPENDVLGNQYLLMARNQYKPSFWGFLKKTKKRFLAEKRAANDLNHLSDSDRGKFETFKNGVVTYFENLEKLKVTDKYFAIPLLEKILYLIFTLVFAVPALAGLLLNFLPVWLSIRIANKTVTKKEFYDSVNLGVGAILALLYFILLFLLCLPFFGWKSIFVVIAIRFIGFLYLLWREAAWNTVYWFRAVSSRNGRNLSRTLQSQRKFILGFFG